MYYVSDFASCPPRLWGHTFSKPRQLTLWPALIEPEALRLYVPFRFFAIVRAVISEKPVIKTSIGPKPSPYTCKPTKFPEPRASRPLSQPPTQVVYFTYLCQHSIDKLLPSLICFHWCSCGKTKAANWCYLKSKKRFTECRIQTT